MLFQEVNVLLFCFLIRSNIMFFEIDIALH